MKRNLVILSVAFLAFFSLSAFITDNDPLAALLKKLEEYTKKYPQEKVHLHLDKPYYAAGDDIWFKAYIVDSRTSEPTAISNILYVELINDRDSIAKQIKLSVEAGISWGDFKLADTLSEGNYRIRAYTQWMRNAGTEFFFDKTVKIGSSWNNEVFVKATNLLSTEGGNNKITSTIKFTDKQGNPYANAAVNYQAQANNKTITKGKGITNGNGELIINTNNNQLGKSGKIIAAITVNKQKIVKRIPLKTTSNSVDVQFFPEGGSLIEGLPTKIGLKAINTVGMGEDISGTVVDSDGAEILKFETTHLGMGSFLLSPTAGKTYMAKVKFANGTEKTFTLPKIEKSGYALSINNTDTAKVAVKVMLSADLLNNGELKLVAQHNGVVYFSSTVPTSKQVVSVAVAKSALLSGITQFTLFSPANIPVSERIVFIDNSNNKINLEVQQLNSSYLKKGKVDLALTATNNNKPIQGSFSVAVTNTATVTPDLENESNILTRLLLTGDLVGYVEKPNYYFLANDSKTQTALDNLMLTQGWRKINWKLVDDNQEPVISFQPEKTVKISGRITRGGEPVANGKVALFSASDGLFAIDTLSNAKGEFNFDQIIFTDSAKFVVQARTEKGKKNIQIDLDLVPGQAVTPNENTGDVVVNVQETMMPYLNQSNDYFEEQHKKGLKDRTIMLDEIKVIEKKNIAPGSKNLNGPGNADYVLTAKQLKTAYSLAQYIGARRLPGVTLRGGQAYLKAGPMSVFLDGSKMSHDFKLSELIDSDIESVEVLRYEWYTAMYGFDGGNGVLVITTKGAAGTRIYHRYTPGIVTFEPKGLYAERQFYSPKYDVEPSDKPDLRTTVYWNPNLISDSSTGKLAFNYFNADQIGTYRVVIEGIDMDGNLARKVYTYQVN
ncbi:TonB-dependent receptor [Pedobacter sp. Hv1]|uniref:TonB-dependent receptor n=1 Tax=Pedobacter sp. Hv1 TaxID=1740090 RepID=UPI000AFE0A16|nr:TonB-dependent receptor [Pedobacter sp. Hv1]